MFLIIPKKVALYDNKINKKISYLVLLIPVFLADLSPPYAITLHMT